MAKKAAIKVPLDLRSITRGRGIYCTIVRVGVLTGIADLQAGKMRDLIRLYSYQRESDVHPIAIGSQRHANLLQQSVELVDMLCAKGGLLSAGMPYNFQAAGWLSASLVADESYRPSLKIRVDFEELGNDEAVEASMREWSGMIEYHLMRDHGLLGDKDYRVHTIKRLIGDYWIHPMNQDSPPRNGAMLASHCEWVKRRDGDQYTGLKSWVAKYF